jgi:hypothetical protein
VGGWRHPEQLPDRFLRARGAVQESPDSLVVLYEDVEPGPVPVRQAELDKVKPAVAQAFGSPSTCGAQPDRICNTMTGADGALVYAEWLIVRGRLVVVHATGRKRDGLLPQLKENARLFTDRLRRDNP